MKKEDCATKSYLYTHALIFLLIVLVSWLPYGLNFDLSTTLFHLSICRDFMEPRLITYTTLSLSMSTHHM